MQHRLNLRIKTRQNVHPRTLVAFIIENSEQHYPILPYHWQHLGLTPTPNISFETLTSRWTESMPCFASLLIELKSNEAQAKITQIITGHSGALMKLSAYDEYVNASTGKIQPKGKGKGGEGKRRKAELASTLR